MPEPFNAKSNQSQNDAQSAASGTQSADLGTDAPEADLDLLRGDLTSMQDRLLRAQAELENYRKRARRELDDERRYADLPLLRDLLPVVDNVSRAIEHAEKKADAQTLLEGFKMVSQQLAGVLSRHNCTPIVAVGEPFDPHLHEAIMQQPKADVPENTVVGVGQVGFKLFDRVVRPAQVIVSTKPSANKPAAE